MYLHLEIFKQRRKVDVGWGYRMEERESQRDRGHTGLAARKRAKRLQQTFPVLHHHTSSDPYICPVL